MNDDLRELRVIASAVANQPGLLEAGTLKRVLEIAALKRCTRCGHITLLEGFYRNARSKDGRHWWCAGCSSTQTARYASANREKVLAAKRERHQRNREVEAAYKREYRQNNREATLAAQRDWRERNRERTAEYNREYRARRGDELKAYRAVATAIERGDLPPINERSCEICGEQAQEYHHESYERERWLDVNALCKSCHKRVHLGELEV